MNREKFKAICAKAIVAACITSGMFALGAQTASAQSIIASLPFAFSAGDQHFPAGTYQFTFRSSGFSPSRMSRVEVRSSFRCILSKMNRMHPTTALSSTTPKGERILKQFICASQTGVWSCYPTRVRLLTIGRPYKARRSAEPHSLFGSHAETQA